MNFGAGLARGDILLFLHADTKLNADHLINLLNTFKECQSRDKFLGCFARYFSSKSKILRFTSFLANLRAKYLWFAFGDQALFCSANLFEKINGFPKISLFEDLEFCLNAKKWIKESNKSKKCNFFVLKPHLKSSARRYAKHGVTKQLLKDFILIVKYFLKKLKTFN